jgi:hypothetical protein
VDTLQKALQKAGGQDIAPAAIPKSYLIERNYASENRNL